MTNRGVMVVVGAEHVVLFVAAVLVGLLSSLLGIGGGSFMVPLLLLGGFVTKTKYAVGTSIAAVAFTSLSSSVGYVRDGKTDLRLALLLAPMTVVGGYYGAVASDVLPERVLTAAFGVFLVYPGVKMALDTGFGGGNPVDDLPDPVVYTGVFAFGGVVGFASGLFGIGGGSLMVPALALVLGLSITEAVATSLLAMFPSAVVASYKQFVQGNLFPELALPLVLGITVGAGVGPYVSRGIPERTVRRAFGVLLLVVSLRMVARAFV
ncbi:MAG: sulfite exporter TauE/SafE family protein [Halobacteria archaeon]|nr:sulfite exporter TauE/SafE family protein [Halobacteria archaeon]